MGEGIQLLRASGWILPFGLDNVVLAIELESAVDLFANQAERITHLDGLAAK